MTNESRNDDELKLEATARTFFSLLPCSSRLINPPSRHCPIFNRNNVRSSLRRCIVIVIVVAIQSTTTTAIKATKQASKECCLFLSLIACP